VRLFFWGRIAVFIKQSASGSAHFARAPFFKRHGWRNALNFSWIVSDLFESCHQRRDIAKFFSRSHDAVIRVYDEAGNVIETHEHADEFKEW
jgi:hypothetical protein